MFCDFIFSFCLGCAVIDFSLIPSAEASRFGSKSSGRAAAPGPINLETKRAVCDLWDVKTRYRCIKGLLATE